MLPTDMPRHLPPPPIPQPVVVHLAAAIGNRCELTALSARLRVDSGVLQMLPTGAQDFVSFKEAVLELQQETGSVNYDLQEGFASFSKGVLTVMVNAYQEAGK